MARVLIAEDQSSVRLLCRINLEMHGFDVDEAADGIEALERLSQTPPSALLLDLFMPRLGGYELVKMIRSLYPHLPIVVMSANHPDGHKSAQDYGADRFLPKPFNVKDLIAAIKEVLRDSSRAA